MSFSGDGPSVDCRRGGHMPQQQQPATQVGSASAVPAQRGAHRRRPGKREKVTKAAAAEQVPPGMNDDTGGSPVVAHSFTPAKVQGSTTQLMQPPRTIDLGRIADAVRKRPILSVVAIEALVLLIATLDVWLVPPKDVEPYELWL